ncbi:MAG TPA: hypothetical protein PLO51_00235 [Candidatus Micrarchaeota archaeon]|nr:hypothetical protein [Candidatus Micrarchaeota archaeon]
MEELNKMMALGMFQFGEGQMTINGRRAAIMPIIVLVNLRERIAKKHGQAAADELMFEAGRFQTASGTPGYLKKLKVFEKVYSQVPQTGHPALEMGREALKFAGWGDHKAEHVDPDGMGMVVRTFDSPIAEEYLKAIGRSGKPVCHYMCGVLAGVAQSVFNAEYEVEEISCKATGLSDECIFKLKKKVKK